MYINLKIEDRLYDHYVTKHGNPKHYMMMKRAIEAFSNVAEGDRVLILHGDARKAIEAVFQTTADSPEKLAELVKKLNSFKIEGFEVNFSADELARVDMQAQFHGKTREQFLKDMVEEIRLRMLEQV